MATSCCSALESKIFVDFVIPEGIAHRKLGSFYQKNPIMSRAVATPIAFLSGTLKVFLFPVICAVGIVAMPIIAIIRSCTNQPDSGEWLKAWGFCILGLGGSVAFLCITTYHCSLLTSSALFMAILTTSVIIHVNKLIKEPVSTDLGN